MNYININFQDRNINDTDTIQCVVKRFLLLFLFCVCCLLFFFILGKRKQNEKKSSNTNRQWVTTYEAKINQKNKNHLKVNGEDERKMTMVLYDTEPSSHIKTRSTFLSDFLTDGIVDGTKITQKKKNKNT